MSWDLTIRSAKGSIGSLASAREVISRIFPTAQFGSEPSGVEKVRIAEAQGIKFPSIIRESMISQPAKQVAEFEGDDVSFSFDFGAEGLVREIAVEVRGKGNPFPYLRQLASVTDWRVIDDSMGHILGMNAQTVGTGWEKHQRMLANPKR